VVKEKVRKKRFLKKARKNFCYPRPLSGQSLATQTPALIKSFLLLFFKKEVLACLTFCFASPALAQTTLNLSATGQQSVTPDQVTAALTAQGNSRNMGTAQNEVNTAMAGGLALAKGVAGVEVSTANYAVTQNQADNGVVTYQASQELDLVMAAPGGVPAAGFSALLGRLQARGFLLQDFEGALSAPARRGAEQAALTDALRQIQAQAKAVAAALGERVGRFESVTVNDWHRPPMPMMAAAMAPGFTQPQAAPSAVQVQVDVNAVVDLAGP